MDISKDIMTHERRWLIDEKYDGVETSAFRGDLVRLAHGEPLAYLIGHIPYLDTTIFLDSRPLIPRSETEYWTGQAISEIKRREIPVTVLDLCAGSGCIGVAVLNAVPMARVDFCEINASHCATITKNLEVNTTDLKRVQIYRGDLFAEIAKTESRYDFILANPPYIARNQVGRIQKSVMAYEPAQALFGGADGMEYIARIITQAPQYLAKSGVLYIEHEPEQKQAIHALARSLAYTSCETHPDQWQTDRYTRLVQA